MSEGPSIFDMMNRGMMGGGMGSGFDGIPLLGLKNVNWGLTEAQGYVNKPILQNGGLFGIGGKGGSKTEGFLANIAADFKRASEGVQPAAEAVHIEHYALQDAPIDTHFNLKAPPIGSGDGGSHGMDLA